MQVFGTDIMKTMHKLPAKGRSPYWKELDCRSFEPSLPLLLINHASFLQRITTHTDKKKKLGRKTAALLHFLDVSLFLRFQTFWLLNQILLSCRLSWPQLRALSSIIWFPSLIDICYKKRKVHFQIELHFFSMWASCCFSNVDWESLFLFTIELWALHWIHFTFFFISFVSLTYLRACSFMCSNLTVIITITWNFIYIFIESMMVFCSDAQSPTKLLKLYFL